MIDWLQVGDLVLDVLQMVGRQRKRLAAEASRWGISLGQLTAAAIVEAIRDRIEKAERAAACGPVVLARSPRRRVAQRTRG